jgi:hypothetical protein
MEGTVRLSAEVYQQVVASLTGDEPSAAGREKRVEPRVGVRGRATVILPNGTGAPDAAQTVPVRNVSRSGMGILTGTPLAIGEQFVLILRDSATGSGWSLLFSVIYCQQLAPDLFSVGGKLVELPRAAGEPPVPGRQGRGRDDYRLRPPRA